MCIVSFAWQAHPRWKLIVIGNRDEMHARPADPLARWTTPNHLLAGRDAKAGGTWLGVSEQGRLAVVTNLAGYGMPDPDRASRGDLLKDFLTGSGVDTNLNETEYSKFNPFNLISVIGNEARIHANRPEAVSRIISSGIYGLSNGTLDDPWLKSDILNSALAQWIERDGINPQDLLSALSDETSQQPLTLRKKRGDTDIEPKYSPIFIRSPVYGTRCSTVVAIDQQGLGTIIERRFTSNGETAGQTQLSFSWPQ